MTTLRPLLEQALNPLILEEEVYHVTNSRSGNIVISCKSANCVDVGDFIPKRYTEDFVTSKPYEPGLYRLQCGPGDHTKTPELLGFLGCRWYQPCATTLELLSFVSEYESVIGIGSKGRRELKKVELTPETRWSRKHVFLLRADS